MKILFLAYACEPNSGSEYGVGWEVPSRMAKSHSDDEIFIITRSRCKEKIKEALSAMGLPNFHVLFFDIPKVLYYKNEMHSKWGEQFNYIIWQLWVKRFVRNTDAEIGFDIIHHLTFNQYRTPSPGFWMKQPFVMGPVGGAECIAPAFWEDLLPHTKRKEKLRAKGVDLSFFGWLCKRSKNKKLILCSSQRDIERLLPFASNCEVKKMPAIAFSDDKKIIINEQKPVNSFEKFRIIYAGRALDWKGLHIFLKAVHNAYILNNIVDFQIQLVGIRFQEEQERVKQWITEQNLIEYVELIPFVPQQELLEIEANCDLFVYPAFRDSGSMSVLEACALGLTSICFDAGGQDIFPDDVLIKIPIGNTYQECQDVFSDRLQWAYNNRASIKKMGQYAQKWVRENLTWEQKIDTFVFLYNRLLVN